MKKIAAVVRITSYNVCYTKLLRLRGEDDDDIALEQGEHLRPVVENQGVEGGGCGAQGGFALVLRRQAGQMQVQGMPLLAELFQPLGVIEQQALLQLHHQLALGLGFLFRLGLGLGLLLGLRRLAAQESRQVDHAPPPPLPCIRPISVAS